MSKYKEKPKTKKKKRKSTVAIPATQQARMMKEKCIKELDRRPEGADNETNYATDQVEGGGRWAVDELADTAHRRTPRQRRDREKERPKHKEKPTPDSPEATPAGEDSPARRPANPPKERQAVEQRATTEKKAAERPSTAPKERPATVPKERPAAPPPGQQPSGQRPGQLPSVRSPGQRPSQTPDVVPAPSRTSKTGQEQARSTLNKRRRGNTTTHHKASTTSQSAQGVPVPEKAQTPQANRPRRGAVKERPRTILKTRGSSPVKTKPIPSTGPAPVTAPAAKSVATAAKQTTQRQMMRQMAQKTQKAAKTALDVAKKVAVAVKKAVTALVSSLVGLIGRGILLVALVIVIVIAAVANSPFGLFFAEEPNASDTVSVAQAVGTVNVAYNAKLEEVQAGDYDSIEVHGQAPEWPDVLAVFAVKLAGADADGVDVATLDANRVDKLTAVFWDMTSITTEVETIDHPDSDPDDETDDSWTEYILHITITPKTADDMRTAYGFTDYQNSALDELLSDRAALSSLAGSLAITSADVRDVLDALPVDLSPERREVVETALQLVGKVNYFWGGKSLVIGWDSRWGQVRKVTADGNSTTGTYRPYGLDCSGFADWVFYNATGGSYILGHGGGAHAQHTYCTDITWAEAKPGDLVFYPEDEHVGIVCGRDESGNLLIVHCASSGNNVVITGASGFTSVARPEYFNP